MQPLLASDPTHVGDYRLLGRLGKGSMGAVYLARSRGGRVVAVKVIRTDLAEDDEFRERFRREAAMARSVGGFWTAAVVDTAPDAEQPWLATEYVPGPTLHRAVSDHGALPEQSVRTLAAGLAEALGAVHRAGLVHRDLKPGNVLLGPDGPRVIDFGIARATAAQGMTQTGMFLGTPGFFSPEQTSGGELGPASDVFSLGAVLTFAATGDSPFGNESTAAMLYQVVHADPDLSDVPDGLRPLLAACLAKDPSARPTTASLLDQLGEPNPRGDQWLPAAINATIHEHQTHLKQAANSDPPPRADPPRRSASSNPVQAPGPAQSGARNAGAPVPAAPPQPAPDWAAVQRTDEISPVKPKSTSQQPATRAPAPEPQVRADNPGPVFATRGRVKAFVWVLLLICTVIGIYVVTDILIHQFHFRWLPGGQQAMQGVVTGLCVIGGLLLLRMLTPALKLKINSDGLRISRAGLSRELPWRGIHRVGVVGRGKHQTVAVWIRDDQRRPRTTWWHRVRKYHGGFKVFRVGAAGGWWSRRKEIDRVHLGLKQYSGRRYDNRLL